MITQTRIHPITAMIAEMVRQTNEVSKKTESAISKITSLEECKGCNIHFASARMAERTYKHPFNGRICKGFFCRRCEDDPKVKELFL